MPEPETMIRAQNLSKRDVSQHNAKRADTCRGPRAGCFGQDFPFRRTRVCR